MKKIFALSALLLLCIALSAQTNDDPVIMTINGQDILRSEFEYSYNKNNSDAVVDKKTIEEYVDLFINYKLKVVAAEAAGVDTTKAFLDEFALYRNQQVRTAFVCEEDLEHEAYRLYKQSQEMIDSMGGLVSPSHILIMVQQRDNNEAKAAAKAKADSLYNELKNGADFAKLAEQYSDDKGSARHGGSIGWTQKGRTVKEFDDAIFSMQKGELSEPILTNYGYHIIRLDDKRMFFPYEEMKENVLKYVHQNAVRDRIITQNLDSLARVAVPATTPSELLEQKANELQATDIELRNLIREYHDGLLLYEMMSKEVWEKATANEADLAKFFKKNKKNYKWDKPRFRGIAYHAKEESDIEAVKTAIKKLDFDQWAETLRSTFNDSTRRIQVVKGFFKEGDNTLVDRNIFKKDTIVAEVKGFPFSDTYGVMQKQPKTYKDVREAVVADYQRYLEDNWIADLRKKYAIKVDKEVLTTINKH